MKLRVIFACAVISLGTLGAMEKDQSSWNFKLVGQYTGRCVQKTNFSDNLYYYQVNSGEDNTQKLVLFSAKTGEFSSEFSVPSQDQVLQSVSLSNDGSLLACGGGDKQTRVSIFDRKAKDQIAIINNTTFYDTLLFTPDGKLLVAKPYKISIGEPLKIFDLATTEQISRLQGNTQYSWTSLAITSDTKIKKLAAGSTDGTIWLWEIDSGTYKQLCGHSNEVNSVSFSPDDMLLASVSGDGMLKIWDTQTEECSKTINVSESQGLTCVTWTSDGKYIATGGWLGTIRIFDVQTGECIEKLSAGLGDQVRAIKFDENNNYLLVEREGNFISVFERS